MPVKSADSYLGQVLPALEDTASRFAALVTGAPDTEVPVPACPGWTVRDVAAHVAEVSVQYGREAWTPAAAQGAGLGGEPDRGAETASAQELAGRLHRELAVPRAQVERGGGHVPAFWFHGEQLIGADAALGILLGELVVHGHDVARALGRPWPIEPTHAALIVEGLNHILPGLVRHDRAEGLTASFQLRLRGQASHIWEFLDGRLHVNPPRPGRIDVHISGDPATLLLFMYGREPQWKLIATGRLAAWGRKPWLAFTLTSRFRKP